MPLDKATTLSIVEKRFGSELNLLMTAVFRGCERSYLFGRTDPDFKVFLTTVLDLKEGTQITIEPAEAFVTGTHTTLDFDDAKQRFRRGEEVLVVSSEQDAVGLLIGNVVESLDELESELDSLDNPEIFVGPFRSWIGVPAAMRQQHNVLSYWLPGDGAIEALDG